MKTKRNRPESIELGALRRDRQGLCEHADLVIMDDGAIYTRGGSELSESAEETTTMGWGRKSGRCVVYLTDGDFGLQHEYLIPKRALQLARNRLGVK